MLVHVLLGVGIALLFAWLALLAGLLLARPTGESVAQAWRLLPDLLRLVRRLAGDRTLPNGVRLRLWLLLAYLAVPIDLVPDFLPVIGYADDVIVTVVVLRSVVRRAGAEAVTRHWPGSPAALAVIWRLCGLPEPGRL
jgi:uncharacterized membrane protein YkvA (DUF1232 family)